MPSVSANMGLRVWDQNDDTFDSQHLASNFMKLDFHDHSPGRGLQVPTEGFKDLAITSAKLSNAATLKAVGSFSAYRAAALTAVASGTEIIFDTEEWDLSQWYDIGNGRFTPQVAGYYRVNTALAVSTDLVGATAFYNGQFCKNGAAIKLTTRYSAPAASGHTATYVVSGTAVIACNGTTDYISVKTQSSAALDFSASATETYFQGEFIGRS